MAAFWGPHFLSSRTYMGSGDVSSPCCSFPYPAISQVSPGWRSCSGRQTLPTVLLFFAHVPLVDFSFSSAGETKTLTGNL